MRSISSGSLDNFWSTSASFGSSRDTNHSDHEATAAATQPPQPAEAPTNPAREYRIWMMRGPPRPRRDGEFYRPLEPVQYPREYYTSMWARRQGLPGTETQTQWTSQSAHPHDLSSLHMGFANFPFIGTKGKEPPNMRERMEKVLYPNKKPNKKSKRWCMELAWAARQYPFREVQTINDLALTGRAATWVFPPH
jgi:hypothetical protein